MPTKVTKTEGGNYRVSTPGGVKAKGTTKAKAEAQERLLDAVQEIRAGVDRARPAPSTHALRAERGPALLAARSTRRSLSLAPGQRSLRGRCHRGPRRRHRGGDPTMSEPDTPLTIAEIDAAHPPAGESAGEWG